MSNHQQLTTQNEHFLNARLQQLLFQMIESAQKIVNKESLNIIRQQMQSEEQQLRQPIYYLEEFIYTLLDQIDDLQKTLELYKVVHTKQINLQQYKNLETSLQKSEAEVRKHIRLEQQLKIYTDGLEEKNQKLQNQLKQHKQVVQQLKNQIKHIEVEKKDIIKKLKVQHFLTREDKSFSRQSSKIISDILISQPASVYRTQISKYNSKKNNSSKLILKPDKHKKLKSNQSKNVQSSINVSIHHEKKKRLLTEAEIREYTKTIQLNISKVPGRRLIKRPQQIHNIKKNANIYKSRCQSGFK